MKRTLPFLLTALALGLGASSQAKNAPVQTKATSSKNAVEVSSVATAPSSLSMREIALASRTKLLVAYEADSPSAVAPPVPAADRARELPAVAANSSVPVDLSKAYNKLGFVADKAIFDGLAGFDSGGTAFSADDIKPTLEANGVTFKMGVAGDNNIVELQGDTLELPTGKYHSLWMLGAAVNGNQRNVSLTVNYADGSQQVLAQNFSDWFSPQEFPGESRAIKAESRALQDGKRDERPFTLYSYGFALDANKTVQSLALPKNMNVKIAALSLAK